MDLVTASDSLPYVGNLTSVFSLVADALRPMEGRFVFSTELLQSNVKFPSHQLRFTGRWAHSDTYIRSLAHVHGFEVEVSDGIEGNTRMGFDRERLGVWPRRIGAVMATDPLRPVAGRVYVLRRLSREEQELSENECYGSSDNAECVPSTSYTEAVQNTRSNYRFKAGPGMTELDAKRLERDSIGGEVYIASSEFHKIGSNLL